jgi:5-oxoprolinase (ATP-hydrolysing)/N-methylhydantoinase A
VPDSGGPGASRGGLGQRVRFKKRSSDGRPTLAGVYPEGRGLDYPGLAGGKAGGKVRGLVRKGAEPDDIGTGRLVQLDQGGEEVEVLLAGGAGFGDPRARPYDAIDRDLAEGYVTSEGAARDYAVVVENGKVARMKSDKLRAQ